MNGMEWNVIQFNKKIAYFCRKFTSRYDWFFWTDESW